MRLVTPQYTAINLILFRMNDKTIINIPPPFAICEPLKARMHPPSHPLQTRPFPIKLQRRATTHRIERLYMGILRSVSPYAIMSRQ